MRQTSSRHLCWGILSLRSPSPRCTATLGTPALASRTGSRFGDGLDCGVPTGAANDKVVIRRSRSLSCPIVSALLRGLLRRPASAKLLLCSHRSGSGSPVPAPQKSSFSDAEKKAANATNIAIFSLATETSWKNDAGSWESRTEWHRCVAFGKLADFAGTLTKGAHVAIEGELRSHEYQRELSVGTQKTTLTQRVWEIRVDSV
jgi:single-strand DNA-binding protein